MTARCHPRCCLKTDASEVGLWRVPSSLSSLRAGAHPDPVRVSCSNPASVGRVSLAGPLCPARRAGPPCWARAALVSCGPAEAQGSPVTQRGGRPHPGGVRGPLRSVAHRNVRETRSACSEARRVRPTPLPSWALGDPAPLMGPRPICVEPPAVAAANTQTACRVPAPPLPTWRPSAERALWAVPSSEDEGGRTGPVCGAEAGGPVPAERQRCPSPRDRPSEGACWAPLANSTVVGCMCLVRAALFGVFGCAKLTSFKDRL